MSSTDHLEYYRERARKERELAKARGDGRAAAIHAALAAQYEALVAKHERPTARILRPNFERHGETARRRSQDPDAVNMDR